MDIEEALLNTSEDDLKNLKRKLVFENTKYLLLYGHEDLAWTIANGRINILGHMILYRFLVRLTAKPFTIDHERIKTFIGNLIRPNSADQTPTAIDTATE